jgi:hypothetical protein
MANQSPFTAEELAKEAGLPLEFLNLPFDDKYAHLLSGFCDRWESIGYRLQLTKSDVDAIKDDNSDTEVRRIMMLLRWREKFAYKATYRGLIEALLQSGRAQQALDMCRKIEHELAQAAPSINHGESNRTLCVNMPDDPSLIEQESIDCRDHTFSEEDNVTHPILCNDNRGEITTDEENKKASQIFWSRNETAIRGYFDKMPCNLRVLGSQFGLEPYELDEIEHQRTHLCEQRHSLLEKCISKEKLISWEHLAATLEKPALNLRRMAKEIRDKYIYFKQDSLESRSSISSPMSLERSFSSSMEVDQSKLSLVTCV